MRLIRMDCLLLLFNALRQYLTQMGQGSFTHMGELISKALHLYQLQVLRLYFKRYEARAQTGSLQRLGLIPSNQLPSYLLYVSL